jgi:hypothetical protein
MTQEEPVATDGMQPVLMWAWLKNGAEFSKSQKMPGHLSALAWDRHKNQGPVTLTPYASDEHESSSWANELALEMAEAIVPVLLEVLGQRITRWCDDKAYSAIESTKESIRKRFARSRKTRDSMVVTFVEGAVENSSTEVDPAPEEDQLWMSRDEAQQRFAFAALARNYSDEQLRMLCSARIEDTHGDLTAKPSIRRYPLNEVEGRVNGMLEGNPTLLDEIFVKAFRENDSVHSHLSAPRRGSAQRGAACYWQRAIGFPGAAT